jgi:hypothetical protein
VRIGTSPKGMIFGATISDKQVLRSMNRLIHSSAWNKFSRKFVSKILYNPAPIPLESPTPSTLHSPLPVPLVTPMDRYARSWEFFLQTNVCAL